MERNNFSYAGLYFWRRGQQSTGEFLLASRQMGFVDIVYIDISNISIANIVRWGYYIVCNCFVNIVIVNITIVNNVRWDWF